MLCEKLETLSKCQSVMSVVRDDHLFDYRDEQVPDERPTKYCAACGKYITIKTETNREYNHYIVKKIYIVYYVRV